jgi:diguanylate cyclase (GGDEF)-like protein
VRDAGRASLAVFDLDHFKRINDRWGHPAGDAVLKAVAHACDLEKRGDDVLGRIGGEEFAMVMPGVAGEAAIAAAERMRRAVEAAVAVDWPHIPFTASFGVADLELDVASASLWMASADAALYRAKAEGRNRVSN